MQPRDFVRCFPYDGQSLFFIKVQPKSGHVHQQLSRASRALSKRQSFRRDSRFVLSVVKTTNPTGLSKRGNEWPICLICSLRRQAPPTWGRSVDGIHPKMEHGSRSFHATLEVSVRLSADGWLSVSETNCSNRFNSRSPTADGRCSSF